VGQASAVQALRAQIRHLAAFDTLGSTFVPTLLLQGETGTGKGLVARVIHDNGPRAQGPFVEVNCAAIPETLLEAELFGFEAGTFTDARRAKPGLMESAVHGTLFLDEIDALPLLLQSKLLSAMDEKRVRRLGAVASHQLDVKFIAATPTDLSRRVTAGHFRADLYHRLAVVILDIPPLRERGADMLVPAQHFLRQYAEAHGLPPRQVSSHAAAWLQGYGWPGNVRELSHLMERVTLLSTEAVVTAPILEHLCLPRPLLAARAEPPPVHGEAAPVDEAARIRQALSQTGGNVARAAQLLGISRGALRYWMRRYAITRPPGLALPPPQGSREPHAVGASTTATSHAATRMPSMVQASAWEQKPVVVLALDLTWPGAMDLDSQRLEPWTVVTRWHQLVGEKIQGFGGVIIQSGPAPLLAVFGIPQTLEQMPQRAVQAALTIRHQLAEARGTDGRQSCPAVRMAVHGGQILVDVQASTPTARLLALEETLSLPVRLLGLAAPGEILLSPEVGRLVEGWFELQGRDGPADADTAEGIGVYAVVGLGPRRSPLEVYGKRPLSRFVGRERELTTLHDLLAHVAQGHGQVVGIVGEPGVGKSRLCYELTQAQPPRRWLILESSPTAYGKERPYLPVIALLTAYFQLDARGERQTLHAQVRRQLHTLGEDRGLTLSAVLALLDLPVDDPQWQALEPPQRRQRMLEACTRLLLRASQDQLVLLIVENLHWIDSETQVFLDHLIDSLPAARLMLLVTYRPDYAHAWGSKTYYTQLRLDPLPPASVEALLHEFLGPHPILASLIQLLIARTAGNPFFLEESVRTLVETGGLVGVRGAYSLAQALPTLQVPSTVQAVLAARMDRLPPEAKALLQTAAVIGSEVPLALLQEIVELPETAVHASLRHLQAAEFLYATHLVPEHAYAFKHALTHEVAYGSLSPERRRGLHARIVAASERLYADRLSEQSERLAHHALRSEAWDKAVAYYREAGVKARSRAAYRAAVACFDQALAALAHVSESPTRTALAIDLRLDLGGGVLGALGEYQRDLALMSEAEALARGLHDQGRLGRVLVRKTQLLRMTADHRGAIATGQQALALAATLDDRIMQMAAAHRLGQAYFAIGDFEPAVALLRQNVASLAAGVPDPRPRYGIQSRAWLALVFSVLGEFAKGQPYGEEALRLTATEGQGNLPSIAHGCLGFLYLTKGDLDHAIRVLDQGLAFCRATDNRDWARQIAAGLGQAYALTGHITEGLALLEEALRNDIHTGALHAHSEHLARLSEVCLLAGRLDEARQHAHRALDMARQHHERGYEARALCQLGAVYASDAPSHVEPAATHYRQALALAEACGMRPLQAHCHRGLGTLYARMGQPAPARSALGRAIELYRAMDMPFWLPEAEAALAQVTEG
jgi:DNA-binding NtrC family response regulator/tetratricopeptide (TPR) repeat protein